MCGCGFIPYLKVSDYPSFLFFLFSTWKNFAYDDFNIFLYILPSEFVFFWERFPNVSDSFNYSLSISRKKMKWNKFWKI